MSLAVPSTEAVFFGKENCLAQEKELMKCGCAGSLAARGYSRFLFLWFVGVAFTNFYKGASTMASALSMVAALVLLSSALVSVADALMYTYLSHNQKLCVLAEGVKFRGKEEKLIIYYGFNGETQLEGTVTLNVRTGTWFGPTAQRTLDPASSSVIVDLVSGPEYRYCFEYSGRRSKVAFEYDIGRAHENPLVDAHEERVDEYMDMVQILEAGVAQVADEMEYLLQRQEAFEGTVRSTYFRVVLFTVISAAIVCGTTMWQIWTAKRVFRDKKVV